MVAVAVVRGGVLAAGADEACDEAGGRAVLVGDRAHDALAGLTSAKEVYVLHSEALAFTGIASQLAMLRDADVVILPASPDGRDLAPHLARVLDRPLFAGAVRVGPGRVTLSRCGGRVCEDVVIDGPFVATLIPGVRGVTAADAAPRVVSIAAGSYSQSGAVVTIEVLPADPATMDLTEARRIVAGGNGIGSAELFAQLARIGEAIGASLGGTRVASDAGWIPFERQIGTTGVAVNPRLYLAFGISGATQHTSGLGDPDHIVSVNTDASCPMMSMADLAIVSDAKAVLGELAALLGVDEPTANNSQPVVGVQ